ncbi:hypothetical protein IQ255_23185 [Pleurocapsales cyanobacterium LEGE 10410]|nr:hypothetical protein [Pleurocapsales cyanobacterium LEGE 10410]
MAISLNLIEESNLTELIPNAENAVVDIRKLRDYCLNSDHSTGKHKARLFQSTLGMVVEDAPKLRQALLGAVKTYPAKIGEKDIFGQRYSVDFRLEWRNKSTIVRSGWIIENDSTIPRLTSCYPLI